MSYLNVGVNYANGKEVPTKKALREAMRNSPDQLVFYTTSSMFDGHKSFFGDDLPKTNLSVVGPDPFNYRKWYATITATGKVT